MRLNIWVSCLLLVGIAATWTPADNELLPAARRHVKTTDQGAYRFDSRLKRVVELNFTMGFHHTVGKYAITSALKRIVDKYGGAGPDSLTLTSFTGGNHGAMQGSVPDFTLEDLLSGEVIVANNIAEMGSYPLGSARRGAIQQAIEVHGRGYLGYHGSGENSSREWQWFTTQLFPFDYSGRANLSSVAVYKHLAEYRHMVLENVLEAGTSELPDVPDELESDGSERVAADVPVRFIYHEKMFFKKDITRDSAYSDRVTPLINMDWRPFLPDDWIRPYVRKGGNLYSYLYKVGKAYTAYIPAGHEEADVLGRPGIPGGAESLTGFDGGVGDFDRYSAQLLFFLAGYDSTACDSSCLGLPIVDAQNRLTGLAWTGNPGSAVRIPGVRFERDGIGFSIESGEFQVTLQTITGRIRYQEVHHGPVNRSWNPADLPAGAYVLRLRPARGRSVSIRYNVFR